MYCMGILSKITDFFRGRGQARSIRSSDAGAVQPSAPRTGGSYDYDALVSFIGNESAMRVATVYRCVSHLADAVANLPMQYMRRKGDIFVEDENSRFYQLLNFQPDGCMSAVDFWQQLIRYMLLRGNAYVVPVYNLSTFEVDRLALVNPAAVSHDIYNDLYTVSDLIAGVSGVYREEEIIHIKNFSLDGKTGMSTLSYARVTTGTALAGDKETMDRFANGGSVRGIVSNDTSVRGFGEYQDNELQKTAADLDSRFRAGERIVSLPGQAQFAPISLSSTDMQFLETRKFSVREICRFFGVHPSFVFDDTSNNYKSAEMANVAFLSNTLNPILRKIECELLRKLVPPSLCCKRRFLFDRRGLYACDLASRVKYQADTIAAGLYTVNEWRREENKPPVEGGDRALVSANLKWIEELGAQPAAAQWQGAAGLDGNNKDTDENGE